MSISTYIYIYIYVYIYSNTLFYCILLYCTSRTLHFLLIEGVWQPHIKQVSVPFFQQHLLTLNLCHILVILAMVHTFSLLLYLL